MHVEPLPVSDILFVWAWRCAYVERGLLVSRECSRNSPFFTWTSLLHVQPPSKPQPSTWATADNDSDAEGNVRSQSRSRSRSSSRSRSHSRSPSPRTSNRSRSGMPIIELIVGMDMQRRVLIRRKFEARSHLFSFLMHRPVKPQSSSSLPIERPFTITIKIRVSLSSKLKKHKKK